MDNKKKFILYGLTAIGVVLVVLILVSVISMFTSTRSYSSVEKTMRNAAIDYFTEERLPSSGKMASVSAATLVAEDYMKSIESLVKDTSCEGNVTVYNNNGEYLYFPVLKCAQYQSNTIESLLLKDLTVDGDGLYTTDIGFLYKGERVNNYVSFAGKIWRVIRMDDMGVRMVLSTSSGKSVRWDNRYNVEFNTYSGINDYPVSRIKESLDQYYQDEKNFTVKSRNHLLLQNVCIGKRDGKDSRISLVELDCADVLENQYIGLLSVSEYAMASIDNHCQTIFDRSCSNYNYFHDFLEESWTSSALSTPSNVVFYINSIGVYDKITNASMKYHPVIYLHKDELVTSGDGTRENPYVIGNS